MLRFRALGRPIVEGPEGAIGGAAGQRKPVALLALLATAATRGMSRDKILAYLWPETPADRATHRLTQVLYSLKHELQTEDLFLGSADLRLNPNLISTDLADFRQALADRCPDRAVEFYSGPFLDGFFVNGGPEFEQWVDSERADLERLYRGALQDLGEQAIAAGDNAAMVHWCGRLAQADPLNAHAAVRYMEALALTGDRAGALRFGRAHEARLREELDAGPDPAVSSAMERLRTKPSEGASVCVLPFINMGPDEDDYFSDGMTEELTNALTHVSGLRVASRTSAFACKGKNLNLREIGARIGVRAVVEGSTRKVGNRIRVTAQLIDAASGFHMWSHAFERTISDVFALQEEISQAIVGGLSLRIRGSAAVGSLVRPATPSVEAYTLYLRGRYFANKRTPDSLRTAIEYFEQAIELDSDYALAHAGIGECYTLLGFEQFGDLPPCDAMPRARRALERALAIDSGLAEALTWRGALAFLFEYDWPQAEAALLKAIEIKPAYSLAHTWYAVFLNAMGRHEEGLARISEAEQLDPLAVHIHAVAAHMYYLARRYDEALQRHLVALDMDPDNVRVHAWTARVYLATGQCEHGLKMLEAAMRRVGRKPILLVQQGCFLAALGRREEAYGIIDELERLSDREYVPGLFSAFIHRALGNNDEVFPRLEEALHQRSGHLPFLSVEPAWDPMREDPRFQALVDRLGLPALVTHQ